MVDKFSNDSRRHAIYWATVYSDIWNATIRTDILFPQRANSTNKHVNIFLAIFFRCSWKAHHLVYLWDLYHCKQLWNTDYYSHIRSVESWKFIFLALLLVVISLS